MHGLDVQGGLARFGPNEIKKGRTASAWTLAIEHFRSPLVLLLGACVVSSRVQRECVAVTNALVWCDSRRLFTNDEYDSRPPRYFSVLALKLLSACRAIQSPLGTFHPPTQEGL